MQTFHIHIEGQVQGVGFRPFVYRLALNYRLRGQVSNGVDGVRINVSGTREQVEDFYRKVISNPPPRAIITSASCQEIPRQEFDNFRIVESELSGSHRLLLTPDLGLCDDCRREMHETCNRRRGYAFTTCTQCGPRYSIINQLPYDRPRTAMAPFAMCPDCSTEYQNPLNRRHFSQTNSCPACQISLMILENESGWRSGDNDAILRRCAAAVSSGVIVAVKGIGGYLLVCDATQAEVVQELRRRKHRPNKPLALMYPSLELLRGDVHLTEKEASALTSIQSPIVLVQVRPQPKSGIAVADVAPGLERLGVMLPYAPLFEMLLHYVGRPVVATSGNLSGSPIVYENKRAREQLNGIADIVLAHDRDILIPQDDSVLQFSEVGQRPIFLRRSRGYAPTLVPEPFAERPQNQTLLAMGAMMKSAFALRHAGNTYVSQYLGDLEDFDTEQNYLRSIRHLAGVLQARPEAVLVDAHPAYPSTTAGHQLAAEWAVPVQAVQHHEAHFAAILAENGLLPSPEPVLGVIWDGTGLGSDGSIWGGEMLIFRKGKMERASHLTNFPVLLGDKMAREPRLSALSICRGIGEAEAALRQKFTATEWSLYQKMLHAADQLLTSSMGRLFDGVASLLGLIDRASYEGEAAMLLELEARKWLRTGDRPEVFPFDLAQVQLQDLVAFILKDLGQGKPVRMVAARFHLTLIEWVRAFAERQNLRKIAFSGGVWQNALLVDLALERLSGVAELFFHERLSPNDECIALGQLAMHYLAGNQDIGQ
jgi:hydrogenase maturation protein HypF